jgi:lysophospholipase L1-like esterase
MPTHALLVIICLSLLATSLCLAQGDKPAASDEAAIFARSLVTMGDTARLQAVLAKARRGEPISLAVIGGSITQGAAASSEDHRWGNVVAKWWRETFPNCKVSYVNAGIGATGSNLACHRAATQLLNHKPDFVGIEFGVNDGNDQLAAETLEGLVRQVLALPNNPAAMLLFLTNNAGGNAQEWHSKIGKQYGLPMVSFRDAIWPEIAAKRMKWEDVEGDIIHPNDRGHKYCADFVTAAIRKVLDTLPPDDKLPAIPPLPKPFISDVFQFTSLYNAETITPARNEGWTIGEAYPFGKCWNADKPGSVLEFEVEGTAISVAFFRIKKDYGIAQVQVDDKPAQKLDAWFDADWGGYTPWQLIARDLAPGKHALRITLLDEKNPGSTGSKFQLQAVMGAGLGGK